MIVSYRFGFYLVFRDSIILLRHWFCDVLLQRFVFCHLIAPFYLSVSDSNRQNIFNQIETKKQISILVTIGLSNLYVLSQFIMLLTWVLFYPLWFLTNLYFYQCITGLNQ